MSIPLTPEQEEPLKAWRKKYDEMFERMQTPEWREGAQRAFDATPHELGEAAREFARKEQAEAEREWKANRPTNYCNGCCYGGHCLGADPDCTCCNR